MELARNAELVGSFGPGMINLAGRGFFSMYRWTQFSGTGADLAWPGASRTARSPSPPGPWKSSPAGPAWAGRSDRGQADGGERRADLGDLAGGRRVTSAQG
jgi:hypothetical protein